jgi:hypothetical protein
VTVLSHGIGILGTFGSSGPFYISFVGHYEWGSVITNMSFRLSVLIMNKLTVKIMAYACKMAEITDAGISRE